MLKLINVSKTFPGVKALDNVSIDFYPGEIHALLGENGAGKSTLIKIISGLYRPDMGSRILLNNEDYEINNPREAIEQGIQTVYQDLQVIPRASIAENIMIDKLPKKKRFGILDWTRMKEIAVEYLKVVGLDLDPTTPIGGLSIAQKQLIEIAKAIASKKMKILLLDEPTASLTKDEAEHLFRVMFKLKEENILIIFVSHVLEEVLRVADRVSILRDGKCVITDEIENLDRGKIVKYMIGREENTKKFEITKIDKTVKVLEVKHLTKENKVYDVNFVLYKGEILGFYGLVGAGRTELARMIVGMERYDSGEIWVNGKKAKIRSIYEALSTYSIGYVTEDRRNEGLILTASVMTNICITVWERLQKIFGYVPSPKENEITLKQIKNLDIKTTGINQKVWNLSGGNQQKVNIAKWLAAEVEILLIDEPTVGVDIGAKEYLNRLIWELAKIGKSIILISSDMPEIIRLANRILVFSKGRVAGVVDNVDKNYDQVSEKISEYISEFKILNNI